MAKLTVQRGKVATSRLSAPQTTSNTPMRWAVRNQSELPVHISQLSRQETGLACGCHCPACGDTLQAVNAGVDPEHFLKANTLGQFFRHQDGKQRDSCLTAVARLTALQLLVDRQEIDLPGPTRSATVLGISGEIYQAVSVGRRARIRIRKRVWIDSVTASLTLEDGHVVLVRLDSQQTVTKLGGYDGIITITVDDPEVASWDASAVLQKLQLDGGHGIFWDRHWADAELQHAALKDAESQAAKYLDRVPAVLGNLDGLTPAQKSESVLHHVIKGILVNARSVVSPRYRESVEMRMPDGETWEQKVTLDLGELALSQARTEFPTGGIVADVHCHAQSRSASFDLVIEVAVTHRVPLTKLEKIKAIDVPCLEIDVRDFRKRGRITLTDLTHEVLNNAGNKRWLYHPTIDSMRMQAHKALERQAGQIRRAMEAAKNAQRWVDSLDKKPLIKAYKEALLQHWDGAPTVIVSGHSLELSALSTRLAALGFEGAGHKWFVERNGVLRFLHLAKSREGVSLETDDMLCDAFSAVLESYEAQKLATYCLMGLREFRPTVDREDQVQLEDIRKKVMKSLKAGDSTYARTCKFDPLIETLFPRLKKRLQPGLGTETHAQTLRAAAWAAQQASYAIEEAARVELAKTLRAEEARNQLRNAIEAASKAQWAQKLGLATDVDQIMDHQEIKRAAKNMRANGIDVREVLTSAWDAREQGATLGDWLKTRKFASPSDVWSVARLLQQAWLT